MENGKKVKEIGEHLNGFEALDFRYGYEYSPD